MTQGDLLSPTILSVVVDAVVCHWESLMVGGYVRDNSSVNKAAQLARRMIRLRNNG